MKFKFSFLIALSAALVAGCAAYYSVFGLSQLFAGASLAVIIMASSLEFAKIVSVSFLQRYWNKISASLKTYLVIGVTILVCITSAGIYGFLSNAYQETANKLQISDGQLSILTTKKAFFDKSIQDNQNIIKTKTDRLNKLSDLRLKQEDRLDLATSFSEKNKIRTEISTATKEIEKLNLEIDELNKKNLVLSDSSNTYASKAIESKSNNAVAGEIGPLKYLSELTGYPMDKIVNWFILLLIFVFDPLAVALVIATNKMLQIESDGAEQTNTSPLFDPIKNVIKQSKKESEPFKEYEEFPIEVSPSFKDAVMTINEDTPQDLDNTPEETIEEIEKQIIEESTTNDVEQSEPTKQSELVQSEITFRPKKEPVIPTGKVELKDIKEIKESNRGFSQPIPRPSNNLIQRVGGDKYVKSNTNGKIYLKQK